MAKDLSPVKASDEPMSLEKRVAQTATTPPTVPTAKRKKEREKESEFVAPSEKKTTQFTSTGGVVLIPAGEPPVKLPDGADEEEIKEWAFAVVDAGRLKGVTYLPEAVVYWVRFFFDINGPDYARVRDLILKTLCRQEKPLHPDDSQAI